MNYTKEELLGATLKWGDDLDSQYLILEGDETSEFILQCIGTKVKYWGYSCNYINAGKYKDKLVLSTLNIIEQDYDYLDKILNNLNIK